MAKSIAEAIMDVADYIEQNQVGADDLVPRIHEVADRRREAAWKAVQKSRADMLRGLAARSETEPVTLSEFTSLISACPVPDPIRLPAEWAIYDRYGA